MKQKILFVISALFGLMMLNSGLNKFFHYMPMPEPPEGAMHTIMAFAESGWIFPLVGIVEIIAAVLIIVPKTRALGAIMMLPIMVGILLYHIVQAPAETAMAAILLLINAWIIFENKDKYMPMIASKS